MNTPIDRDLLRSQLRAISDHQRRLVLERVVEHLPDAELARLLDGLVHVPHHHADHPATTPSLRERIESHAAATRRGDYFGNYILRNAHGQREPHETADWLATTSHLFDCALSHAERTPDAETLACLRTLSALAEEVDQRTDEWVVFEDDRACDHLLHDYPSAKRLLERWDASSHKA
ncbi:MAG: hypothetical protein GC161_02140 [Planctomycetaceae bacterium]|nr:hypothetical protein [Planctomycetaceae bacterium]